MHYNTDVISVLVDIILNKMSVPTNYFREG